MTEGAFHTVWIPLQDRFYRTALFLLEDRAEALDAVQDLYVKLWNLRGTLDLVQNPVAYGNLLLRNLCIDRIRRRRPRESLDKVLAEKAPPDEALMLRESLSAVTEAIDQLPPRQKKLLTLHVLQGHSYDEMARETGLSPLNIRVQVSLARKKLKKQYEDPR